MGVGGCGWVGDYVCVCVCMCVCVGVCAWVRVCVPACLRAFALNVSVLSLGKGASVELNIYTGGCLLLPMSHVEIAMSLCQS